VGHLPDAPSFFVTKISPHGLYFRMLDLDTSDWISYCRGETAALGRIYGRHKDKLFSYCLYLTRHRNASEDIVQESFTRLMTRRDQGDELRSVANWLFICARNLALNQLARHQKETEWQEAGAPVVQSDPETARFVERVLHKLDVEERDLILLREQQLFSTAELAEMFDVTEEAIRVRLYRIRKKMQELAKEWL
jgi:RNA polymerase sigma factor (sigma-70 family)